MTERVWLKNQIGRSYWEVGFLSAEHEWVLYANCNTEAEADAMIAEMSMMEMADCEGGQQHQWRDIGDFGYACARCDKHVPLGTRQITGRCFYCLEPLEEGQETLPFRGGGLHKGCLDTLTVSAMQAAQLLEDSDNEV